MQRVIKMSHNQSTLQGMTIKEHEKNNRKLQMIIIKLRNENKSLRKQLKGYIK